MTIEQNEKGRAWEQKLAFYHPNSAGGGSALQLEPRVNLREGDRYNCFFLELATQKTPAIRQGEKRIPATFDWEHKLTVKLDFADICELLCVLEGKVDKAGGQRNGIYHENGQANTIITFQKNAEKGGFFLALSKKSKGSDSTTRIHMALSDSEAVGLRCIFQVGLFMLPFHTHLFAARHEYSGSRVEA